MGPIRPRVRVAVSGVLAAGCLMAVLSGHQGVVRPTAPVVPNAAPQVAALTNGTLPIVAEHRYRVAAKIRPLVLFWIGKDNVGGARLRWRRGENDERGYDLLIGSDPDRAPRRVNRWGFILEESRSGGATVLGVMKRSDEETLKEATSRVASEANEGVVFKMIQATIDRSESVARVTISKAGRDYSYRELDALLEVLLKETSLPKIRKTPVPPGGRSGLLTGIAELLHDAVESVHRAGKAPGKKSLAYAYYAKQYDVARISSEIQRNARYGGTTYATLLKSDFEVRARGEPWTESFAIVCGLDGPLAEIPVFLTYQPRWWFKVEMTLDEREVF